jgi:hypothetical protein
MRQHGDETPRCTRQAGWGGRVVCLTEASLRRRGGWAPTGVRSARAMVCSVGVGSVECEALGRSAPGRLHGGVLVAAGHAALVGGTASHVSPHTTATSTAALSTARLAVSHEGS